MRFGLKCISRLAAIAALAVSAGSIGAPPASAQGADKTLRVAVHADLKIFDPVWASNNITRRYAYLVYDTLFSLNSKFEPQPQMVDTYSVSEDGLTYEFTLRSGLQWHDGAPVTAADCVASVMRWMPADVMGQRIHQVLDKMEVVDNDTFRLILKKPYGFVLYSLAASQRSPFMMPERVAKTPSDVQIKEYIGSGPFKFVESEWVPGDKVVYVRNDAYVPRNEPPDYMAGGKVAKLDRVEWRYIPDNNTVLSALQAGEIDYFEIPPLEYTPILESNPDIKVMLIDRLGQQGNYRPNHLYPPFDNPLARQALLYLIDQPTVMKAAVGNEKYYLQYCGAFFMCNSDNETHVSEVRTRDVEKARQLFKEAGYDGRPVVFLQPTDRPLYNAATMLLIEGLREAGVNVQPKAADWSTISTLRAQNIPPEEGGWNLFVTASGPDTANPLSNVWFNSRCEAAAPGWPCDEEVMKLIDQWAEAPTTEERKKLTDAIQTRAYEMVPYAPWGQYLQPVAFRSNVTGVFESGMPVYWNIDKE